MIRLGVSDETRLGALRFKPAGKDNFLASSKSGVPTIIELGRLLNITERIFRDEETDEDLQMIFAPGTSLGGARPKASVIDQHGNLYVAKFPKENDEYSTETWEEVALQLAFKAGIRVPKHRLVNVGGKSVLLSQRFDRVKHGRIPFASAMTITGSIDGEEASYLDIVDAIGTYGAQAKSDRNELFRRMVFNVLISNCDDHLRNHGFLRLTQAGWSLSPVFDLNPVPQDIKPRILTTRINYDDGTCSLALVRDVAELFGFNNNEANKIISEVALATQTWEEVAKKVGVPKGEIKRMKSAFEHEDS